MPDVTIYTDGGCKPNPGPGGWAALLISESGEYALSGNHADTTNNQMELTAAIAALESLDQPHNVTLYTDSTYLKKGITEWLSTWQRNGWRTANNKPVQNKALWQRLYHVINRHDIEWKWVRSHAGNEYNERVDKLATAARREITGPEEISPETPVAVYMTVNYQPRNRAAGWGAVIVTEDGETTLGGGQPGTTENRMTLVAAHTVLEAIEAGAEITFITDSEYLHRGMTAWIHGWKKRAWRTAKREPVKYADLWQMIDAAAARHAKIIWRLAGIDHKQVLEMAANERKRVQK